MTFAALSIAPLLIQVAPLPPPPISISPAPADSPSRGIVLVDFTPGEVRCDGTATVPTRAARPRVAAAYLPSGQSIPPYTLRFNVSADGRTLGIGHPIRNVPAGAVGHVDTDDLAATLAGWRFAPGAPRAACTVSFMPETTPVATAPAAHVHRYAALPRKSWTGWNEALERLRALDCASPRGAQPLLRAYPDYSRIDQPPGTIAYSVIGYDLTASGRPVNLKVIGSEGNAALDRAALRAVAKSRFSGGARRGCNLPFHRAASIPLEAPAGPPLDDYRPPNATCPRDGGWARGPRLLYPEEFRQRQIEGWAIVRYDVAPWGAVANVEVAASEPAAAFGEQAKRMIQGATRSRSATGGIGCTERVVFRMQDNATSDAEPTN